MSISLNSSGIPVLKRIALPFRYFFRYILKPRWLTDRRRVSGHWSYSSAGEDVFVLATLDFKRGGAYLEIGSQDPISASNTFLLERQYGWKGVSLEIRDDFNKFFSWHRDNSCVHADATNVNYESLLQQTGLGRQIDYLQVDIDPAENNLLCLQKLPLDQYRFSVITFEHDVYASGEQVMQQSRALLHQLGYQLVAASVQRQGKAFEDWWVDPLIVKKYSQSRTPIPSEDFNVVLARLIT